MRLTIIEFLVLVGTAFLVVLIFTFIVKTYYIISILYIVLLLFVYASTGIINRIRKSNKNKYK